MLEIETRDAITTLRLAHGKVNAIDQELLDAMQKQLQALEKSDCRGIVLTGSGKSFSAGVDVFRVFGSGQNGIARFLDSLHNLLVKLLTFPVPVVAAINGHAIAGGCIVACACDYRLMARGDGKIGVTELLLGIPFPTSAFEVLRATVASHYLHQAVYSGETFPPEAALARGFVDELVEPEALQQTAFERARRFAAIAPAAFVHSKRQLRHPALQRIAGNRQQFDAEAARIWQLPEIQESIQAYIEKVRGK